MTIIARPKEEQIQVQGENPEPVIVSKNYNIVHFMVIL